MLFPQSGLKIWFCAEATDMRKSFNGLAALVKNKMEQNPLSGEFFVFVNRRKTMMKILFFDRNGYSIWFKRLEAGVFQLPTGNDEKIQLSYTQLTLILEGIDIKKISQRKRYKREINSVNPYNGKHANDSRQAPTGLPAH